MDEVATEPKAGVARCLNLIERYGKRLDSAMESDEKIQLASSYAGMLWATIKLGVALDLPPTSVLKQWLKARASKVQPPPPE